MGGAIGLCEGGAVRDEGCAGLFAILAISHRYLYPFSLIRPTSLAPHPTLAFIPPPSPYPSHHPSSFLHPSSCLHPSHPSHPPPPPWPRRWALGALRAVLEYDPALGLSALTERPPGKVKTSLGGRGVSAQEVLQVRLLWLRRCGGVCGGGVMEVGGCGAVWVAVEPCTACVTTLRVLEPYGQDQESLLLHPHPSPPIPTHMSVMC